MQRPPQHRPTNKSVRCRQVSWLNVHFLLSDAPSGQLDRALARLDLNRAVLLNTAANAVGCVKCVSRGAQLRLSKA